MIDDDPGVYNAADRTHDSLLHMLSFDDPDEQRKDTELQKLAHCLDMLLKHDRDYHARLLERALPYTGLVPGLAPEQRRRHSALRVELLSQLSRDFDVAMDAQERLCTLMLFDRYCAALPHGIEWDAARVEHYVLLMLASSSWRASTRQQAAQAVPPRPLLGRGLAAPRRPL